ncbi:hypothetical protein ABIC16_004256 [Sphingomonas sp. PvP055]|uniref:hypothetical protein n=1 Tax=Sphingomonas sp. PvP055 TaxID=3156391 RepID=UPI003392BB4B
MKICVLNIEMIPNARAMADARYTHTGEVAPWPLHELAAALILTVERTNWDSSASACKATRAVY